MKRAWNECMACQNRKRIINTDTTIDCQNVDTLRTNLNEISVRK